jgi:hypothetical protein
MAGQRVGISEFTQQAVDLAMLQRYDDLLPSRCARSCDENGARALIRAIGKGASRQERCGGFGGRALPELEELNFMQDASVVDETEGRIPGWERRWGHERIVFAVDLHRSGALGAREAPEQSQNELEALEAVDVVAHRASEEKGTGLPPNESAHHLRAIVPAPAQTYASLAAPSEGAARAAPRVHPARRLHALFRAQPPGARKSGSETAEATAFQYFAQVRSR